MKLTMRRHGDPIGDALNGLPTADASIVALVADLRAAAGTQEAVPVVAPIEAITEAVLSGANPSDADLRPVAPSLRRRLVRYVTTASLAAKLLFGAAAIAAVTTTVALTGVAFDQPEDVPPAPPGSGAPVDTATPGPPTSLPEPSSTVPEGPIEYRDAVAEHNRCRIAALRAHIEENGNAVGFDATAACGERPHPSDFDRPNAPGLDNNPSDTRPAGGEGTPADTRPGRP